MQTAFDGSPGIKANLLENLDRALREAGDECPDFLAGICGSPDPGDFANATGFPLAIILPMKRALQWVWNSHPEGRAQSGALARRWLADVRPGAVLDTVPVALMIWLLFRVNDRSDLRGVGGPLNELLQRLVWMHERLLSGIIIENKEWRQFRAAAIASTDALTNPLFQPAARAIEAGAWEVTHSSIVLADVLDAYRDACVFDASARSCWTPEDERRAITVLEGIYAETQPQRDIGETVAIPPIFHEREPEIAAAFEANLKVQAKAATAAMAAFAEQAIALMAAASVAHDEPARA